MPAENRQNGRPTIRDVADEAGVSRALVSIVMRGAEGASAETRRRIFEVADQLGYRPDRSARLLRQSRTRLLGVVFDLQQGFHADVITRLYPEARLRGFDLVLSAVTGDRTELAAVGNLRAERCEGYIFIGPRLSEEDLAALAGEVPVMVIGSRSETVDSVATDEIAGTALATEHLIGLGHRDIIHLDGGDAPSTAARREGYERAMRAHGLEAGIRVIEAGETELDGARAARSLFDRFPTGVVAFNDRSAVGVISTLLRDGILVPSDVSVTGFDDSIAATMPYLQITTIAQEPDSLAGGAVGVIADRIEKAVAAKETGAAAPETARAHQTIPARLLVRDSTAAVRHF